MFVERGARGGNTGLETAAAGPNKETKEERAAPGAGGSIQLDLSN